MAMDEEEQQIRRLDFDAPLLSVRRIPSRPAAAGPVGNPGLVPFAWEQAPGRPKPPPGPTSPDPIQETGQGVDNELSDALSPAAADPSEPSPDVLRRFRKDPQLGELMMGRFLAAAKAVATGPLQSSSRKAGRVDGDYGYGRERKRVPLPFQHQPEFVSKNGGGGGVDYDDGDGAGGRHFSMARRLIPRFFLLNPVDCLESRGAPDLDEVEHSWDAVYTHKLRQESLVLREDGSKLTSESNRLTYWSESQSPDGSSSYYGKGWKSGSFGSYEKSGESNLDRTPSHGNWQGSESMSSADRNLYVDSVQPVDTPYSMSISVDEMGGANNVVVVDGCRVHPECYIPEPGLLSCSARQHCEEMDGSCLGENGSKDSLMTSENDKEKSVKSLALSLLPPPLPSSPCESWLQRTLSSVSSKNPPPQSLLGIQVQHRNQLSRTLSKDSKWITDVKSSKADSGQIRSTEVLK